MFKSLYIIPQREFDSPKNRLEIFCQKVPADAATAASTPASAEALLAVKKVVRSARPRKSSGNTLITYWESQNDKLRNLGIRPLTLESLE